MIGYTMSVTYLLMLYVPPFLGLDGGEGPLGEEWIFLKSNGNQEVKKIDELLQRGGESCESL